MPRRRSVASGISVSSKMDTDGSVESELAKLQRQFKIMERDRQRYGIQAREQIHKEQQEIQKLLKEQEDIQQNLGACKSMSQQQKDYEETQRIHCLLEQWDTVQEECETQKQTQKQLDKEISDIELQSAEMQKRQISSKGTQRSEVRHTQKAIRTLEHKLDRVFIHFNELQTKNSHLREDMQTLHKERTRFQQLRKRLDKELAEAKKKTGEVINVSIAAYDDRVKTQTKMLMMREKAVKDFADDNSKMKSLEIDLSFESRLKAFMTTKCSERPFQYNGQEMVHRQELKEQKKVDSGKVSMDTIDEVFQRIQDVSGEDNLDMLITTFIQGTDRNFAVFNFVNEQNNEVEILRDQISQIQGKMEQLRVKGMQQKQNHHCLLRNVDEQLNEVLKGVEDYENQTKNIQKILDLIKTEVYNISKIDCDRSEIEKLLGTSTGISDSNIMAYLGLVEQNANELLTIHTFLNFKELEKDYNQKDLAKFLLGQKPEVPQLSGSILPPVNRSVRENDAGEGQVTNDEERPLSRGELYKSIIN